MRTNDLPGLMMNYGMRWIDANMPQWTSSEREAHLTGAIPLALLPSAYDAAMTGYLVQKGRPHEVELLNMVSEGRVYDQEKFFFRKVLAWAATGVTGLAAAGAIYNDALSVLPTKLVCITPGIPGKLWALPEYARVPVVDLPSLSWGWRTTAVMAAVSAAIWWWSRPVNLETVVLPPKK